MEISEYGLGLAYEMYFKRRKYFYQFEGGIAKVNVDLHFAEHNVGSDALRSAEFNTISTEEFVPYVRLGIGGRLGLTRRSKGSPLTIGLSGRYTFAKFAYDDGAELFSDTNGNVLELPEGLFLFSFDFGIAF